MAQALQWLPFYLKKKPKSFQRPIKLYTMWLFLTSSPDMTPSIHLCSGNTGLLPMPGTQLRYLFIKHSALLFVPLIICYPFRFLLHQKCFRALFRSILCQPFPDPLLTYFIITCPPYQVYFLLHLPPSNIFDILYIHIYTHIVSSTSVKYKLHDSKICWSVLFHAVSPLHGIELRKCYYLYQQTQSC